MLYLVLLKVLSIYVFKHLQLQGKPGSARVVLLMGFMLQFAASQMDW